MLIVSDYIINRIRSQCVGVRSHCLIWQYFYPIKFLSYFGNSKLIIVFHKAHHKIDHLLKEELILRVFFISLLTLEHFYHHSGLTSGSFKHGPCILYLIMVFVNMFYFTQINYWLRIRLENSCFVFYVK